MGVLSEIIRILPGFDPYRESDGFVFREDIAFEKLEFWETYITHIEGDMAGEPYKLEIHEVAILANLFGWVCAVTGLRRFREVLYYVPRGNSKTTFAAGLCLLMLFTEPDWRMQLFSCGSDGEQAAIVYDIMVDMIESQPELEKRVHIYKSPKRVVLLADKSSYKPLSSEAKTKHGKNANFAIYDETHTYPNGKLIEAVHTSMVKRKQPLEIHCTTAGEEGETILNKILHRHRQVRDGDAPGARLLPIIYEIPQVIRDADPLYWTKEEYWRMANPLYGKALSEEYYQMEVQAALSDPEKEESFKRLHLNVQTSSFTRFLTSEEWRLNDGDFRREDFEGQECAGAALDLALLSDMVSLCLLFGDSTKGFNAFWWHWIPEAAARAYEIKHSLPFTEWARDGWVKITPGNEIDYDQIEFDLIGPDKSEPDRAKRAFKGIGQRYVVTKPSRKKDVAGKGLAIDRMFQGAATAQRLVKAKWVVEEFGQGYFSMTAPTASMRSYVRRGMWRHGNDPVMRWQASNAVAVRNVNDDIKVSKLASRQYGKVDGIITGIMATGMALRAEVGTDHAYAKRGLLFIDKGKRWRKFWITDEELELLNAVEGRDYDLLLADIFAGYGCRVDDLRPNPHDQREFTAQVFK